MRLLYNCYYQVPSVNYQLNNKVMENFQHHLSKLNINIKSKTTLKSYIAYCWHMFYLVMFETWIDFYYQISKHQPEQVHKMSLSLSGRLKLGLILIIKANISLNKFARWVWVCLDLVKINQTQAEFNSARLMTDPSLNYT